MAGYCPLLGHTGSWADSYAEAIDKARGSLEASSGNLIFDFYEAEQIDDEEDDSDD